MSNAAIGLYNAAKAIGGGLKGLSDEGNGQNNKQGCGCLITVFVLLVTFIIFITSIFMTDPKEIKRLYDYMQITNQSYVDEITKEAEKLASENDSLKPIMWNHVMKHTTDNSKEIISMAAVFYQQDFGEDLNNSERLKIQNYMDELFIASHNYDLELSEPYSCSGCKTRIRYCSEKKCSGHSETYCPGEHRDVIINSKTYTFDEIFEVDELGKIHDKKKKWEGWDDSAKGWAKNLYEQNWEELYGIDEGFGDDWDGSSAGNDLGLFFSGNMVFPVGGSCRLSSNYGWRGSPFGGGKEFHTGMDFAAAANTPILAADDGVVIFAGYTNGYGNLIKIDHGDGVMTYYAHIKSNTFKVNKGTVVKAGQHIAGVGTTGPSTGNHLHFEVRVNGKHTDPKQFI